MLSAITLHFYKIFIFKRHESVTWLPLHLYVVNDEKGGQMTNNCEFHALMLIF